MEKINGNGNKKKSDGSEPCHITDEGNCEEGAPSPRIRDILNMRQGKIERMKKNNHTKQQEFNNE